MEKIRLSEKSVEELLALKGFTCPCGKTHGAALREVYIGENILSRLPDVLKKKQISRPALIADTNTWQAAGKKAAALLSDAGISCDCIYLANDHPHPDEYWCGTVLMRYKKSWDGLIAVGTGTINDICKILANAAHLPYLIIGTAPSMDGYASETSSVLRGGFKLSLDSTCPGTIFADTTILASAPLHLIQAGFGDMVAKYTSICEWRIGHLITGEYYCEEVARLVRRSVKECTDSSEALALRDPAAAEKVMRGLILSGLAMAYAGISRPASGTEHYFSHIWDMWAAEKGESAHLHGIQCGVGTLLTLKIYDYIKSLRPNREKALAHMQSFSMEEWEAFVHRTFGAAANGIILQEKKEGKYQRNGHSLRLERILNHWDEILAIIDEELPSYDWLLSKMKALGAPVTPAELGISREQLKATFLGTKDIRDKYISTRLLWDLGELEDAADALF